MLPQRHRLSRRDFQLIYSDQPLKPSKITHANGQVLKLKLIKYASKSSPGSPLGSRFALASLKVAIILSKKVAKYANKRNYLKRQLRAILRSSLAEALGWQANQSASYSESNLLERDRYFLVITFLPFEQQPSFSQLQQETLRLLSQIQLI